jgi:hypothetical protein
MPEPRYPHYCKVTYVIRTGNPVDDEDSFAVAPRVGDIIERIQPIGPHKLFCVTALRHVGGGSGFACHVTAVFVP